MATSILWEPHAVACHASGELSVDDIAELNHAAYNDPRYPAISSLLLDFSQVTSTSITVADVTIFASADHLFGQLNQPRRMAIIFPPIPLFLQLAEHYRTEILDTPLEIAFFESKSAARNWLSWETAKRGEIN